MSTQAKPDWNQQADFYNKMASMELGYTRKQLEFLDITKEDSVLDLGCGTGRISITVADNAKCVTAVDSAEKMLEYTKRNAQQRNITNIRYIHKDWNDLEIGKDIEKHDVVIASRTDALSDPEKFSSMANKLCVYYIWANSPSIPVLVGRLFEGVAKEEDKRPMMKNSRENGYIKLLQKIYELGYEVNSKIVEDGFEKNFLTRKEAYDYLWSLRPNMPMENRCIFEKNADKYLTDMGDVVHFSMKSRMVCIYWKPIIEEL